MIPSEAVMATILFKTLMKFSNAFLPPWLPLWSLFIIFMLLWWLLLWGIKRFLIRHRRIIRRSPTVITEAHSVLLLAGSLFFFNLFVVPVVLVAFNGMAFYTLIICMTAAVLYLYFREDDIGDMLNAELSDKGKDIFSK